MIKINKDVLERMIGDIDFLQSQMEHLRSRINAVVESEERMDALKSGDHVLYEDLCKKHA